MTKEDKQIIDRAIKEEWRIGDRTRLKRLLEKNLKLYRENVELENNIADIKANCDLAIEGKDVKIMELEKENAELNRQLEEADNATDCFNRQEEIIEQAKELLKNIIRVTWGEGWNYSLDWKVKAEQFLNEVEK